jgi:hypothetical protein
VYAYSPLPKSLTATKFDLVFLFAHSRCPSWTSDNLLVSGFRRYSCACTEWGDRALRVGIHLIQINAASPNAAYKFR